MTPEISILLKATLALIAGLWLARLFGNAPASVRHLILAATFGALLALPVAAMLMPTVAVESALFASAPPRPSAIKESRAGTASTSLAAAPNDLAKGTRPAMTSSKSLAGIALAVWAMGSGALLSVLAASLFKLRAIRRQGLPWMSGEALAHRLARESGLSPGLTVLLHETVSAPMTCGITRPLIVMPRDAPSWKEEDLLRAFIHELEHVRRGDWAVQIMARTACALYWFHPLAWVAWRQLCLEGERACDDAVVNGSERTDYAQQLVTLAERMSHGESHPALSMANRSDLSIRVRAVLDAAQLRGRPGRPTVAAALGIACLGVFLLAPLSIVTVARAEAAPESSEGGKPRNRARPALAEGLIEAAEAGDIDAVRELLDGGADPDAVVIGDGSPLIAAARGSHLDIVRLLLDHQADPNVTAFGDGSPLIAAARSGSLEISNLLLDSGADIDLGIEGDGNPLIMAAGDGRVRVVTLLLDRGADIEAVVRGDENPLIHASESGHLEVVQLLVGRGADVNARVWASEESRMGRKITGSSGEWRTPLVMAERGGHNEVARYLRAQGATR